MHRKFVIQFFVALILIDCLWMFLVYAETLVPSPLKSMLWYDGLIRSKTQVAKSKESPKLVVAGGSGVNWSISARTLESRLGVPCSNFGTFVDITLPVLLESVDRALSPKDTVLLSLEYDFFDYNPYHQNSGFVKWVTGGNEPVLKYLSTMDALLLLQGITFSQVWGGLRAKLLEEDHYEDNANYSVETLTADGDETNYKPTEKLARMIQNQGNTPIEILVIGYRKNYAFDRLKRYLDRWKQNDIRVLATFPAIIHADAYGNYSELKMAQKYREFFTKEGVPLMGDFSLSVFPKTQMHDGYYHLSQEGRQIWSSRLADWIESLSTWKVASRRVH